MGELLTNSYQRQPGVLRRANFAISITTTSSAMSKIGFYAVSVCLTGLLVVLRTAADEITKLPVAKAMSAGQTCLLHGCQAQRMSPS